MGNTPHPVKHSPSATTTMKVFHLIETEPSKDQVGLGPKRFSKLKRLAKLFPRREKGCPLVDLDELQIVDKDPASDEESSSKSKNKGLQSQNFYAQHENQKVFAKKVDDPACFCREVKVMQKIKSHPNIVKLVGVCPNEDQKSGIIILQKACMDLTDFIETTTFKEEFSLREKCKLALDIARGLRALHSHKIVHRDLKTDNILISYDFTAKIADFGLSSFKKTRYSYLHDEKGITVGNALYMAPEVMQQSLFNESSDIYSFSIIFWEVLHGKEYNPPSKYRTFLKYKKYVCKMKERPPISTDLPLYLQQLLTKCWQENPGQRPTAKLIIKQLEEFLSIL